MNASVYSSELTVFFILVLQGVHRFTVYADTAISNLFKRLFG